MDRICIKGLEVFGKHGVLPEENTLGQKFVISATLFCDTRQAGRTDDLKDSVNYAQVSKLLKEETEGNVFQLVEALAWHLAKQVLLRFKQVQQVVVEVEKPWAPVQLLMDTVSVQIQRGWNQAYLGVGSNLGDREKNIRDAIAYLEEDELTRVEKVSTLIVTEPVGYTEQEDFLNGAIQISTLRSPEELLELLQGIEQKLKRERVIHWGPRTIDLDILLFNQEVVQKENLCIPHIEMENRMFVLKPLCEIAPYAVHPLSGRRVRELKMALEMDMKENN